MLQVSQGRLGFKLLLEEKPQPEVTAYAGLPLLVETAMAVLSKQDYKRLACELGYFWWQPVRRHLLSLLVLVGSGGGSLEDLETLRADEGLNALLGMKLSSPTQAKDFLYRFHQAEDGSKLSLDDDKQLTVSGKAQIRPEGPGLRVLAQMNERIVEALQAHAPRTRATLDVDATIVEAHKRQALRAYEGTIGYQPQMAWWAEQQVWVCDEFRDGNVPAEFELLGFLKKAFGRLPSTVSQRRLRGDSALYNEAALTWAADEAGIEFAVSADMSPALEAAITAVPQEEWKPYRSLREQEKKEPPREEREWAEVNFVPGWERNHKKDEEVVSLRYLAIRVRSLQRDLLVPDAERWRHFAVVTNMNWEGERLLRWHREKQGTVEHAHGVLKNDLGGGKLPCGRFGANSAWWRLNVLAANLLQMLKVTALPAAMQTMTPKTLRFRLFNLAGRLVSHGRQLWLRISEKLPTAELYAQARKALLALGTVRSTSPPSG
jgi:hypothetical protein